MEQVSPCLFRQGSRREGDRTEQTQQEARREKKVEEGLAECLLPSLLLPSFFLHLPRQKKTWEGKFLGVCALLLAFPVCLSVEGEQYLSSFGPRSPTYFTT